MENIKNGDIKNLFRLKIYKQNRKTEVCVDFVVTRKKPRFNVYIASFFVFSLSIAFGLHYWTNYFQELTVVEHSEIYFVLSIIIVLLLSIKTMLFVEKETLLVIVPVGIQFTTTYAFGRETVMFIPWSVIKDILIVEVITGQKVIYYLAVTVIKPQKCDNKKTCEGLVTLFRNTRPRLASLQEIYQIVQRLLHS